LMLHANSPTRPTLISQGIGVSLTLTQRDDELGQRLKDTVALFREKRSHYDSSIILLRKHCDYMLYAEGDDEHSLDPLISRIRSKVDQTYKEWGLKAECFRKWFNRDIPMDRALTQIFSLEVIKSESCRTL